MDELAENRRLERLGYRDIDDVIGSCDPVCDAAKDGIGDGLVEHEIGDTIDPAPVDSLFGEIEDWL